MKKFKNYICPVIALTIATWWMYGIWSGPFRHCISIGKDISCSLWRVHFDVKITSVALIVVGVMSVVSIFSKNQIKVHRYNILVLLFSILIPITHIVYLLFFGGVSSAI